MRDSTAQAPGRRLFFAVFLVALFAPHASAQLVISEFRLRGPGGAQDEFIEIQNRGAAPHTVVAASGTGYAIAASDGLVRCSIPNGTILPPKAHWLCVGASYSLWPYPAGNGETATGDGTYTTDIPDNAGLALFNNNTGGGSFSLANRLDAVGSTSEANTLYKEGTGYPALTVSNIEYAFVRDNCGKGGAANLLGACPLPGQVKDTDNNSVDFYFVDTNGTSAGAGQRLGAPGPENRFAPTYDGAPITTQLLDQCVAWNAPPNQVRGFTSEPGQNSTFGTLSFRRRFTNNTGVDITRLRFRIIDLDTFPAAPGFADLRPRTSSAVVVAGVDSPPCGSVSSTEFVSGTTLEQQPPSQPHGGGFNSSYGAGTVTLGTPFAHGTSLNLQFLVGVQQTGNFRIAFALEALPAGGGTIVEVTGATNCTEGTHRPGPGVEYGGCPGVKGDFNNDAGPDIVYRNVSTGTQNKVWLMNGVARLSEAAIVPDAADANWLIRGADDFNNDGLTDLVFWNQAAGNVEFWLMNGTTRVGSPVALTGGAVLAPNWELAATADFNYDGRPDIVWRNATSQNIVIWTMNGTSKIGALTPTPPQAVDSNWTIVAATDYDNDGNTDFLWYNLTTGNIVTWYMNSSVARISGQFATPMSAGDSNWKVLASADYGKNLPASRVTPDILWRNATSGNQVVWHMDFNSTRIAGEFTSPGANSPALNWTIVGPR